jgi:hypothetical protein
LGVAGDRVVTSLRKAVAHVDAMSGGYDLESVPTLLKQVVDGDLWRERLVERTGEVARFSTFEDFVTTPPLEGLGSSMKLLRDLCRQRPDALDALDRATQRPVGVNQHTEGGTIRNTLAKGTTASQALRRLRKDRPDLHARVLAGELSAHAAMLEAGFRRKTITVPIDIDGLARALHRHLTPEERAQLARRLE